jgi:NMD protein affecting ribosome stability and mRNA decay
VKPLRSAPAPSGGERPRAARSDLMDAANDDPYQAASRPPEPTRCPGCNASFQEGRWSWAKAPADAHVQLCPACQREQDQFPAGYVTIKGAFFADHRDEIIALIQSHEKREKAERPLQRIMAIEEKRDGIEVATTDSHLARGIAQALQDSYKGDMKLRYSRDENLVRASWKREK